MTNQLYNSQCRLFLIINDSEYLIREPSGWGDAKFSIKRTENHGFKYNFPSGDLNLAFHDRKTTNTAYQKAKTLIDSAFMTYGADVNIRLRFEYFDTDWKSLDTIELGKYTRNEYDSTLRTQGKVADKQLKDLLNTKISLYDTENYLGNAIERLGETNVWFHSKIIDKLVRAKGSYGGVTSENILVSDVPSTHYVTVEFPIVATNEISDYNSSLQNVLTDPPNVSGHSSFSIKENGLFKLSITEGSGAIWYGSALGTVGIESTLSFKIDVFNKYGIEKSSDTIHTSTRFVTVKDFAHGTSINANFEYQANEGDEIYIYLELSFAGSGGGSFSISTDIDVHSGNMASVQSTQIEGGYLPCYKLLPSMQKMYEILSGSSLVHSDLFESSYPDYYITSGSILKGGGLSIANAPITSISELTSSIDAIFNTGYNFEVQKNTFEVTAFKSELVQGSVNGYGNVADLSTEESNRVRITNSGTFITGEIITGLNSGAIGKVKDVVAIIIVKGSVSGTTVEGITSGATADIEEVEALEAGNFAIYITNVTGVFLNNESLVDSLGSVSKILLQWQELSIEKVLEGETLSGNSFSAIASRVSEGYPQLGYSVFINGFSGEFIPDENVSTPTANVSSKLLVDKDVLRVESSEYFYNTNNQVINLTDRDIWNVEEKIAEDYIFNEAEFSYPELKYDELNTVDEANTKAEYLLSSKRIKNKYIKKSSYKTQGQDIEFLRRKALKTSSTAFKEDKTNFLVKAGVNSLTSNVTFFDSSDNTIKFQTHTLSPNNRVIEMIKKGGSFLIVVTIGDTENNGMYTLSSVLSSDTIKVNESISVTESYTVCEIHNNTLATESTEKIEVTSGSKNPDTLFNIDLTPTRNKMRHDTWLNVSQHYKDNNDKSKCVNYDYNGELTSRLDTPDEYYDPDAIEVKQNKDWNLSESNRFKHFAIPYEIRFTCNLTFNEWLSVLNSTKGGDNKYGYVTHKIFTGETADSWILKIEGSPKTNEYTFTQLLWRINSEEIVNEIAIEITDIDNIEISDTDNENIVNLE